MTLGVMCRGTAHGDAALPGQHPRAARPQLVERHRDRHADRAQGRRGRRQGAGDDDLDLLTKPELVTAAWDYFNNVQTKDVKYIPFIKADTPAPTFLNEAILGKYREQMKPFYYDPSEYPTYLDQLGIVDPTVRTTPPAPQQDERQ